MFPIDLLVISRPEYLLAPTLWSLSTLFFTPVTSRCIFGHWSNYTCDNYTWSVLTSCRPLADFRVLLISPSGAEDVSYTDNFYCVYSAHFVFGILEECFCIRGMGEGDRVCQSVLIYRFTIVVLKIFTIYPCAVLRYTCTDYRFKFIIKPSYYNINLIIHTMYKC